MNTLLDDSAQAARAPESRKTPINQSIQGLRGFAALLVATYHVYAMSVKGGLIPEVRNPVLGPAIEHLGPFGVVLFFFISGYLIVQTLVKHADVRKFLVNRCARIYPVFLALTIPMFTLGPLAHYEWMGALRGHPVQYVKALVENVLFLPGMFDMPIAQKNAWSLSYEFAFYLIACGFYLAIRVSPEYKAKRIAAIAAMSALTVASIWMRNLAGFFLVGVAVYLAEPWWRARFSRGVRIVGSLGPVWLLLAFALYGVSLIGCGLAGLLFFVSIVAETGAFARMLQAKPFLFLGRVSYSLYLIHPFVYEPVRMILAKAHHHIHSGPLLVAIFYVVGLPLAVTAAGISYTLIEDRFTNKYLRPRRGA